MNQSENLTKSIETNISTISNQTSQIESSDNTIKSIKKEIEEIKRMDSSFINQIYEKSNQDQQNTSGVPESCGDKADNIVKSDGDYSTWKSSMTTVGLNCYLAI